jgi:LmbE family N-acetylglucosaminyl deacetylase
VLGIGDPDAFGASAHPPTLVLRTGRFARLKLEALRCHRTQVGTGPFDFLTLEDAETLMSEEHYRRADVGSPLPGFIEGLAAPLETA